MTEARTHRMADPATRLKTAIMAVLLVTLTWAMVTVLGRPQGPFASSELPDLAGLPVRIPQIERLLPPQSNDVQVPILQAPGTAPSASPQGVTSP